MVKWGTNNRLEFSGLNTEIISFSRKHTKLNNVHIIVDGIHVSESNQVRYLGVILDRKLSWNAHCSVQPDPDNPVGL